MNLNIPIVFVHNYLFLTCNNNINLHFWFVFVCFCFIYHDFTRINTIGRSKTRMARNTGSYVTGIFANCSRCIRGKR